MRKTLTILALVIASATSVYANKHFTAADNPLITKSGEVKITLNLGNITHLKKSEIRLQIKDLLNGIAQFDTQPDLLFKVNVKATTDSKDFKNLQIEALVSGQGKTVKKEVKSLSNILMNSKRELEKINQP